MADEGLRVAVAGVRGKMGRMAAESLADAPGIRYVGGLVRAQTPTRAGEHADFGSLLAEGSPQVIVDFTAMPASLEIALAAVRNGVRPVIGTSGYGRADLSRLRAECKRAEVGGVYAPNFALGAVLMMRFAEIAAKHFATADIIEMHDSAKKDAPSGTAMATAQRVGAAGRFHRHSAATQGAECAQGATVSGVGVHSLRLRGVIAHQEILFGGDAETLSIRHDTYSRASFMGGMLVAVRAAPKLARLVEGIEELL